MVIDKKEFYKRFNDRVLTPLQHTCNLLQIVPKITFLNEEFSVIINIVLFYTGFPKIKDRDDLDEIYYFQEDIATKTLKDFYKDFVKENFEVKENDDIFFFRYSDLNHNTAIFIGGDNFDGFNITLTEE